MAIPLDLCSAQHLGPPVIEPTAGGAVLIKANELTDLEERNAALGHEAPHERLIHVEHRRNPWNIVELP